MNESGPVKNVVRLSRKRDSVLEDPMLGKIEDKVMARKHGVSHTTAYKARRLAGIPCSYKRPEWRELILLQDDLGSVPDVEIAKRLGCADTTVCKCRNDAGIKPFAPQFSQHLRIVTKQNTNNDLLRGWR